jgi:homoserine kinase type II
MREAASAADASVARNASSTRFVDAYDIDVGERQIDLGGSSNLNLRIGSNGQYVLRVYRPHVTSNRLDEIHRVRRNLSAAGVPCEGGVPARAGEPWLEVDGRLVEIERYVEHDAHMDSWERLATGLRMLGVMHDALDALRADAASLSPRFANYISAFE